MIVLRALGTAEIETDVTTLTPSQEIVFAAALYIIIARGKPFSRAGLAALLWPSARETSRAHRLRQTILHLKKLGLFVRADRASLYLGQKDAQSDFDDVSPDHVDIAQDSLEFLPGYNPRCSDLFRDWVDTKRSEVHALITRGLIRQLEHHRMRADWVTVERIVAKCLTLDPFNETAVLAQAEAAAMRGGKRQAISLLDRYISEVGNSTPDLRVPASILRRRVLERMPDRPALLSPDPPFVGRETEMEILARRFERSRSGKGSAIMIVGEPGIGKSRLSAEFARFAELQGARIQRANCRRTDLDRPLSLFVDMVPTLREMPGALGCSPTTLALLKRVTEVEQRSDDTSRPVDSEMLFHNVREALLDLLDSVAEECCLVILIEDAQWLDAASTKILAQIVEWCSTRRILIVGNCRPSGNSFLDYARTIRLETLKLEGLSAAASTALLRSITMSPADSPDHDFIGRFLSVSEGNPFFLQELAHQWIETGYRDEAPPSVTEVLQERLSRLSREALHVLQGSAVLGEFATVDRVKRLLEYPVHQLLSAIEELSKAAMLASSADPAEGRFQPRHDFLASAAIGQLSPVALGVIHRRAADVLEAEIPRSGMPTTLLWACANHRHQAGDRQQALSLSISCAQHLLDMGLLAEACRRFEESLCYCKSKEDRLNLLPRYSTALQVNGEWEKSKEMLRICIDLASSPGETRSHNQFEILLFQARNRSSFDFVTLLDDIMPCIESNSASPAHRVEAGVIALKIASDVGPSSKLDAIYAQIEPFLANEDINFVARFEAELIYHTMRTDREFSVPELERYAEVTRASYGETAYLNALLSAASACRIRGKDSACLGFLKSALDHALSHKLLARIPVIILSEIRLHVSGENFLAARAAISRGKRYPIPPDDEVTRAEWQFFEARVALEDSTLSQLEEAVHAIEVVPRTYSAGRRAGCLAMVLRLRLLQGRDTDILRPVIAELESAHLANHDIGAQDFEAHSLYLGLKAIGEEERGRTLLQEYVREFRRSKRPLTSVIRRLVDTNFADESPTAMRESVALT